MRVVDYDQYKWVIHSLIRSSSDIVYYIVCEGNQLERVETVFLHRDGTIQPYCGDRGFYNSEEDARKMIFGKKLIMEFNDEDFLL
jgi:hypothetical protein